MPDTTGSAGRWRDAFRLAVGTLTTWRTPPPSRVDGPIAGGAMLLAPLVVVPVGVLVGALVALAALREAGAVGAALALGALALSTRGLHLDGLADLADGLCAGFEPARSLEVMKRSDTGAGGVAAVVLVVLVQAAGLATLARTPVGGLTAGALVVASRLALVWACRRGVPAASAGGLGATVSGTVSSAGATASTAAHLAVLTGVVAAAGTAPLVLPVAGAVGLAGAAWVVRTARRRLGGITGDVLGAAVEIALAASLAAAALLA